MFHPANYRAVLAQKMPGELSPDLLDKILADFATMARNLPGKKFIKWLAWYLHGIATARCFKAMTSMEIASATHEVAYELMDMLKNDINSIAAKTTAA